MASFKIKPNKIKEQIVTKTLDENHRSRMEQFKKDKEGLPRLKEEHDRLLAQYESIESREYTSYTAEDISLRSSLKPRIDDLSAKIYDIENDITETEYYARTDDILIDYYDLIEEDDDALYRDNPELELEKDTSSVESEKKELTLFEKIHKRSKDKRKVKKAVRKKRPAKNTSKAANIFNFLDIDEVKTSKAKNSNQSKSALYDQYVRINEPELYINKHVKVTYNYCEACDKEMVLQTNEGIYACEDCSDFNMIVMETEHTSTENNTSNDTSKGYPYKRENHFAEWLSQVQGKETTEIPEEVFVKIRAELHKQRVNDLTKMTIKFVKTVLKKLNYNNYYEHRSFIWSKLSGLKPPSFSRANETKLKRMFKQIQKPFRKHCPPDRINFLSYSYILHKMCQLLELDDMVKYFPLLINPEKRMIQDKIWKDICGDISETTCWQFIPSPVQL